MGFAVTNYGTNLNPDNKINGVPQPYLHNDTIGLLQAQIVSIDQAINLPAETGQLAVDKQRYELFRAPGATIDKKIVEICEEITEYKELIVAKGDEDIWNANPAFFPSKTEAKNALKSLYGQLHNEPNNDVISSINYYVYLTFNPTGDGLTPPAASYLRGAPLLQAGTGASGTVYESFVSTPDSIATLVIKPSNSEQNFTTSGEISFDVNNTITPYATPDSIQFVGIASVYRDIAVSYCYPNIEPNINSSTDFPYANAVTKILTDSVAGQGIGATFYPNALSVNPEQGIDLPEYNKFVDVKDGIQSTAFIGNVYAFDGSGIDNDTEILEIRNDIEALRDGFYPPNTNNPEGGVYPSETPDPDGLPSLMASADKLKPLKQEMAINVWAGERNLENMNTKKTVSLDVIETLKRLG